MSTARPRSIMIIAGLLILLALLSTTSAITTRTGFARVRQPGQFNGANGNGGNFQGGNGNFQGGNGNNGNFQGGNGNFQNRGGNNVLGSVFRFFGPSFFYVSLGITILGIVLALLSAYGVWKLKKWGLNLGMVIALLFLLGAWPGLFALSGRNINILRASITILSLVASAPILALGILPSVRDSFAK